MISFTVVFDWKMLVITALVLVMFGLGFNWFVGKLGTKKDGYVSFLVVVGVMATLIVGALLSWQAALLFLALFAASGPAMIVGDIHRYVKEREAAKRREEEYKVKLGQDINEELTGVRR